MTLFKTKLNIKDFRRLFLMIENAKWIDLALDYVFDGLLEALSGMLNVWLV